ncbi:putative O-methyltransferase YrrM [Nostoc flagelliforme CCNUN1]|uniref:Putative O-methyltransferase YrrM n=1 Tax=Nostoc flagelliforme CCNUN1 TaxID=2038116 RepID=A0A2K8SY02_9NOSO|nr:TylF/MycF/NovP-related O-methyltransferase [Nostoc flagelliforme]AUB40328.1 putative O-methyltransferase YrrM [Nostoc flagelliforme CCNUN1]
MDIFNTLYKGIVFNGMIQVDNYEHWDGCQKALHNFECLRVEQFNVHRIDYMAVWFKKGEMIDTQ